MPRFSLLAIACLYAPFAAAIPLLDADADGLDAALEAAAGTDPDVRDTDGDGASDGIELLIIGTDPASADTDGDGVGDRDERVLRLDPLAADT
ncbi:MAG: hypothetical protein H0V89_10015, partial [Deltaproteobacteria bacterium]|nr:hypothetical protein [Deltaproteobacteria bacterium]